MLTIFARTGDVGARTLVSAACAGREADGQFMMDGRVRRPVGWVEGKEGRKVQGRVFEEIWEAGGLGDGERKELFEG